MEKGTKIKKICDGETTCLHLRGYVMLEDNWIGENDKILHTQNGEIFTVLDFQEVEENTLVMPDVMPYFNGWTFRKFSCVKFDKEVNMNDVFYIVREYIHS